MERNTIIPWILLFCFLAFIFIPFGGYANENSVPTLYVGGVGDGNYSSIQGAINDAVNGDTIYVYNGVYQGPIVIDKLIKLVGESEGAAIIYDSNLDAIIVDLAADGTSISCFTVRGNQMNVDNVSLSSTGLYIRSDFNKISQCRFINCSTAVIVDNSSECTVENCECSGNTGGISFYGSDNGQVVNCTFNFCESYGVLLRYTNHTSILNSNLSFINGTAVVLGESSYNLIHDNVLFSDLCGVHIFQSLTENCQNNIFYRNNFMKNVVNAYDGCNNTWDNGIIGNYWDDYDGMDTDGDGVGNQPYFIPLISEDRYPSVKPVKINVSTQVALIIVNITSPWPNEVVSGSILIKGDAYCKDEEIRRVMIWVDDGEFQIANGTANWEVDFDTTQYENGLHTIYVYAINENNDYSVNSMVVKIENAAVNDTEIGGENLTPGFEFSLIFGVFLFIIILRMNKK